MMRDVEMALSFIVSVQIIMLILFAGLGQDILTELRKLNEKGKG